MGFSTLNTAVSGLAAAQRAMDITGQNIVNANTPGYSRQVVRLASVAGATTADFHTRNYGAMVGGVTVEDVSRIRDSFLEGTRVAAGSTFEALKAQVTALAGVEQLLAEPGDGGLQQVMDDFFRNWQELPPTPDGVQSGAGAVIISSGRDVASRLAFLSQGVGERWTTAHEELQHTVGQLNQAASDLAKVNAKIREGSILGRVSNELLDQRDVLVRTLGELAGATASPAEHDMVNVQINGISLVAGPHADRFELSGGADLASVGAGDPPAVTFGANQVSVQGGKAAGLLAALRNDLPAVSARLDDVAVAFRDVVNAVHVEGYTLDGDAAGDMFGGDGAANLTVLVTDPRQLGVSGTAGTIDGANAMRMGDLMQDGFAEQVLAGLGQDGSSPSQRWRSLAADVGTHVQGLGRALDSQKTVLAAADAAVESDAGVNLDEEMASLLTYQRAYQAASRVITTVDEMLDTLINRTGTVGR